jgi:hypothetical protein
VNRKILLTVLALTAVLLATPYVGMAYAKPSTTVSGTIMVVGFELLEETPSGKSDNAIRRVLMTVEWTGDIEGSATYEAIMMLHNWVPPMGGPETMVNIHEKVTFPTVTVLDKSGSLTLEANIGSAGEAHWTILSGTGELVNLNGHGTWAPIGDMLEGYAGQVHFDP